MPVIETVESFPAMLRRVLGDRLKPDAETFPDMFAADGVLEYPYAPPGLNTPIVSRDAIVANFERLRKVLKIHGVKAVHEIGAADPDTIILEFFGDGEGVVTKEAYEQRYISVIRMRGKSIAHYKDYWNPLAVLRAVKGGEVAKAFAFN